MSTKCSIYYNKKDRVHVYYDAGTEHLHLELHYVPDFKVERGSGRSDYIDRNHFILYLDKKILKAIPSIQKYFGEEIE